MKKLPVAGPTYDYKLENIRNDIIEQELALCLKRQEDIASNATIVDGDGNTTTLRANLNTEFYTRTEADTAIASATTSLVSETALNTALGDYTNTATLEQNFYTKTDADSAIASATTNLVSTTDLNTELGNYTNTATLEQNFYTKTDADSAIASATTNLVSTTDLSTALGDYTNTATLEQNFYTKTDADSAISTAITTNNVSLGDTYGTIESVQAVEADVDGIEGKYAVKIDNNGHVSGFGLISTANNAAISGDGISGAATTSTFTITADAFKIVDTSSGTATPYSPFKVYTSSRTVDGVTVPAGVYIEDAFITSAEIKTLDVDVINLDGVTLDTSNGELIVKSGGIDTTQIAGSAVSGVSTSYTVSANVPYDTSANPSTTVATVSASANSGDKFLGIVTTGWYSGLNSSIDYINQRGYLGGSLQQVQLFHTKTTTTYAGGSTLIGIYTATSSGTVNLDFRPTQTGSSSASVIANQIRLSLIRLKR